MNTEKLIEKIISDPQFAKTFFSQVSTQYLTKHREDYNGKQKCKVFLDLSTLTDELTFKLQELIKISKERKNECE